MNFNDFKNSKNVLSNEQMKNVKGGGTCGYKIVIAEGLSQETLIECGVSQGKALEMLKMGNVSANWCCDHCGTSSYCG